MTKPFLIVDVTGGILGRIHERETYEGAVDCATALVCSQFEIKPDSAKAEGIRAGIEENLGYNSDYGDLELHIAQAEVED